MKTLLLFIATLGISYFVPKPHLNPTPKTSYVLNCSLITTGKMKTNPLFADVALSFPDTVYGHLTTYIYNDTAVTYYKFEKLDKVAASNPKLHYDAQDYCIIMDLKNKKTMRKGTKMTSDKKVMDFSAVTQTDEDTKYTYYKAKRGDTDYSKIQTSQLLPAHFSPLGCTNLDKGIIGWHCNESKIELIKLEKKSFDLSKIRVK